MTKLIDKLTVPSFMAKVHLWLMLLWILLIIPSALLWKDSVPYLVSISVYAVIMGHVSSWQAARVEQRQDEDDDVAQVTKAIEELKDLIERRG